jgi:putative YhdH/YhfP family quinone oxidoreductase
MSVKSFKAFRVIEEEGGHFHREIQDVNVDDLPDGNVLIEVKYSSLNYKDALSAIGNKGVTKFYPHTPGIDAVGIVVESKTDKYHPGQAVIVAGHDFGMSTWGGFGEYVRVPKEWLVKLPDGLSMKDAMIYGTAGFTAALSIYKMMLGGVKPESGEILVTGATGGVGSIAVSILSKLGFDVIAASGKASARDMLMAIGAKDIIDRKTLDDQSGRPMLSGRWGGVIDTVGGNMLATALKTTKYGAAVTCCGNVSAHEFNTSVYPFILRGVTLYGIDAVQCPQALRQEIWDRLGANWRLDSLDHHVNEITLDQVNEKIDLMLQGQLKGRTIIKF